MHVGGLMGSAHSSAILYLNDKSRNVLGTVLERYSANIAQL